MNRTQLKNFSPSSSSLCLPMTTIFLVQKGKDRTVARALDFDLVTVAATADEALRKLRLAVKTHVEFGIKNGLCKEDIQVQAPNDFWRILTPESSVMIGEPIDVDSGQIITMMRTTCDEIRPSLNPA